MFNWLLNTYTGGVESNTTSGDYIAGGFASGTSPIDGGSFVFGILAGLAISLIIWSLKKLICMLIKDYKSHRSED